MIDEASPMALNPEGSNDQYENDYLNALPKIAEGVDLSRAKRASKRKIIRFLMRSLST